VLSTFSIRALPWLVFALALALYVRTGAPSLLTGDQAEHQMVAAIGGVPHATGYPLFTLLNIAAVHVLPLGDLARRATLMTALWSALAVLMAFVVARRLGGSALGGLVAAATLATGPSFWALSTVTEVYTFQALLILTIWWLLARWWAAPEQKRWLYGAAFLSGVATTHHGSFVPIVAPALLLVVAAPIVYQLRARPANRAATLRLVGGCLGWGLLGLMPWLYLALQFALFRPFDFYRGQGPPYHYYWGNPASWGDVANLALGAGFRAKVFTHGWERLPALGWQFALTLQKEVGRSGVALGLIGAGALALWLRPAALWSALVFVCAVLFGINVADDVPKAFVYYLPAYGMWSVWAGVGAAACGKLVRRALHRRWPIGGAMLAVALCIALVTLPLTRGYRRLDQLDRSTDNAARTLADAVLAQVEPGAVILCRWELCRPLQYVQLVEGRRLDVVLDQTEPEAGADWGERAALYLPRRPVYALQFNEQLAARYDVYPISESDDLWQVLPPR
jgi:4-amino-4-deoxy-L-arabinose transferase-like glycosyltransferase